MLANKSCQHDQNRQDQYEHMQHANIRPDKGCDNLQGIRVVLLNYTYACHYLQILLRPHRESEGPGAFHRIGRLAECQLEALFVPCQV